MAKAQSTVTVTGQILSASGDPVAENFVQLVDSETNETFATTTGSDGRFQLDVPGDTQYILNYAQSSSLQVVSDRPDNIPSHHLIRRINVGSEQKDLGAIELPQAYRVEARVVDPNDRPISGAGIQIRSKGFGLPPGSFTTNEDGYVKHSGADQSGVDLAGPIQIGAWPPGAQTEGRPPAIKRVLVDQERSLTLTLEGATGATEAPQAGSDSDSAAGRQRGFFSNSGNEPAFLSNVFNLTMLGFLMSAAGLIYQMMEGR
ncbi:MAG: carboxypeptidase-like regulatory domain-containing protein [Halobacteriales archaeon]|nr:carboxypeptidase-like regulatory domain-containing protein [Halobacteriales archaeon]